MRGNANEQAFRPFNNWGLDAILFPKQAAKLGGVPGREGSAKPQSSKPKPGMNGQRGGSDNSKMNAGAIPPANKMGPGIAKGAKGVRY